MVAFLTRLVLILHVRLKSQERLEAENGALRRPISGQAAPPVTHPIDEATYFTERLLVHLAKFGASFFSIEFAAEDLPWNGWTDLIARF